MHKRSWPWKRSSDKQLAEKEASNGSENSAVASLDHVAKVEKEDKKAKYIKISMESYDHLTSLENQVKTYQEEAQVTEEEMKQLNERLSKAISEIADKDKLIIQHSKVAEDAVSGWEKAEAETAALKNHLESVTLLKLSADDRAAQLEGAVKECMKEMRNLKEENEQKLKEVAMSKAKQYDKMKMELEKKLLHLDQELLKATAENGALLRSLEDLSDKVVQLSEGKSKAEAQIEVLKSNIELCEKEVHSLKYELHIAKKEVQIRTEEKNMSMRSAELANKQNLEGAKKIAKLEAECQRLRVLVRKKLPGPAAVAQMKLEVENLGRESRLRRSTGKYPSSQTSQESELSLENSNRFNRENEVLTELLMVMEDEMKMLKEALAKRSSELQDVRSVYELTAKKLQSLEANGERSGKPCKSESEVFFSKNSNNLQSFPTSSEDIIDDNVSSSGSWTTGLLSELSHIKREKNVDSTPRKYGNTSNLDLMGDFLEMEKLASSVNELSIQPERTEVPIEGAIFSESQFVEQSYMQPGEFSMKNASAVILQLQENPQVLLELQSLTSVLLESMRIENDKGKVTENVECLIQIMRNCLLLKAEKFTTDGNVSSATVKDVETVAVDQEFKSAVARVCEYLAILGREVKLVTDANSHGAGLNTKIDFISAKYAGTMDTEITPVDFVLDISHVFAEANMLHLNVLGLKRIESETSTLDCIDKIALPENDTAIDSVRESYHPTGSGHFSPNDGSLVPTSESSSTSWRCSIEEYEQLKMEKNNLQSDFARCMENYENTKMQLQEMERLLAEVKFQLSSSQKSNSLADTQLKCMAESYKSLETLAEELQNEINHLQARLETLENELQEARRNHQDALDRCKALEDQSERVDAFTTTGIDDKVRQEELAQQLAECQETIFLLGKQLKTLRGPSGTISSLLTGRSPQVETHGEELTKSGSNLQDLVSIGSDTDTSSQFQRASGVESPLMDLNNPLFNPDNEKITQQGTL